ncbi:MAG: 3-deoxy-manno-octulosonate cytidylyltransferase [Alphaproteobacteria bacterium]
MTVAILIPARYASSRYPGKPLALLHGAGGIAKTLIERSWEAARAVTGSDAVHVVTDDDRIAAAVEGFGGSVLMTSPDCANGTERCAEAVAALDPTPEIVVNLQGDALLTPPWFVEALIEAMRTRPEIAVATPVLRCDDHALGGFLADRAAGRVGATTAVFGHDGQALYFSKEVIPYTGGKLTEDGICPVFHHVGVYAYRSGALAAYPGLTPGPLERWEGLEQLRFMENGIDVLCVGVEARGAKFWELNNPEDVPRIEAVLAELSV